MCPHNTVQPNILQYRKRSPDPYFRLKDKERPIGALRPGTDNFGWPTHLAGPYIEESTRPSQPMIGTNADRLMGADLKLRIVLTASKVTREPWFCHLLFTSFYGCHCLNQMRYGI